MYSFLKILNLKMRNLVILLVLVGTVLGTSPKIDAGLTRILNAKESANISVTFASQSINKLLQTRSFSNRAQKINFLATSLQDQAFTSQLNVANLLNTQAIKYKSFWITNQIFISGVDKSLIDLIANFSEVVSIEEERVMVVDTVFKNITSSSPETKQQQMPEWGLERIQVFDAWEITNGTGIVVANIDTGVRYTHEALRDNYRSEYGWFDPYDNTLTPNDDNGHGTHTMGTIAGSNGIGVAPDSKWIACKGGQNNDAGGSSFAAKAIIACAQWILCPTRPDGTQPDCSKAPNLVSNSWGSTEGNNNWFKLVADAWVEAGIIPIFAIGNEGPACQTNGSPGDIAEVIGVGSVDLDDRISSFSSVGPTADGRIKPDISAPGRDIKSAWKGSDTQYILSQGTSMACPHVAGTVALILSKRNELNYEEVRDILIKTVDTNVATQGKECGGVVDSTFPNNHFGYGRLNALKAVKASGPVTMQNDKLMLLTFFSLVFIKAFIDKSI